MPNSITLANKYSPILDEVYKYASKSAILDTPAELVKWEGANVAKIFETDMQGLGNYSRSTGFVTGDVTSGWNTYTLAYDRGRSLTVDSMDNEETLGMAFGTLAGEFIRTKEVPELDAYRFAKIASTSGILGSHDDIESTSDFLGWIDDAEKAMNDAEVPEEGRILFVSEAMYKGIKSKVTRYLANENDVNKNVLMYDEMQVVRVPAIRFNTKIDLLDGSTSGQTAGGWSIVPSTGSSYAINFMIVHPSAVTSIVKHRVPRIWTPEQNINADAYKFDIRVYGDLFVKGNKESGIYLHRADTANSAATE